MICDTLEAECSKGRAGQHESLFTLEDLRKLLDLYMYAAVQESFKGRRVQSYLYGPEESREVNQQGMVR